MMIVDCFSCHCILIFSHLRIYALTLWLIHSKGKKNEEENALENALTSS